MERVFSNRLIEKEIMCAIKKYNASIWVLTGLDPDQYKYKINLTLETSKYSFQTGSDFMDADRG